MRIQELFEPTNRATGHDPEEIKKYVTLEDDETYVLNVPVNERFKYIIKDQEHWVMIDTISLYVSEDYGAGDLAVTYDLIAGSDSAEAVMVHFYMDEVFNDRLKDILSRCGFSPAAIKGITTSESGMQDEGRASYDGFEVADEILQAVL